MESVVGGCLKVGVQGEGIENGLLNVKGWIDVGRRCVVVGNVVGVGVVP